MILASDLHFGAVSNESLDALTKAVLADPEKLLVVAGDLTQSSATTEYDSAKKFFTNLMSLGCSIVITVGNHDFGGAFSEKMHAVTSHYDVCRAQLAATLQPILAQPHVLAVDSEGFDSISRIGAHLFVSLRSQHRAGPRIKGKQVDWAKKVLSGLDTSGCVLHFLTHHSMWQDHSDRHEPLDRRTRLETELLAPFNFKTYIHGHNHRYTYQNTTTPKLGYRMLRIGVPTICNRNGQWERGLLQWMPHICTEPTLVPLV